MKYIGRKHSVCTSVIWGRGSNYSSKPSNSGTVVQWSVLAARWLCVRFLDQGLSVLSFHFCLVTQALSHNSKTCKLGVRLVGHSSCSYRFFFKSQPCNELATSPGCTDDAGIGSRNSKWETGTKWVKEWMHLQIKFEKVEGALKCNWSLRRSNFFE